MRFPFSQPRERGQKFADLERAAQWEAEPVPKSLGRQLLLALDKVTDQNTVLAILLLLQLRTRMVAGHKATTTRMLVSRPQLALPLHQKSHLRRGKERSTQGTTRILTSILLRTNNGRCKIRANLHL